MCPLGWPMLFFLIFVTIPLQELDAANSYNVCDADTDPLELSSIVKNFKEEVSMN